MTENEEYEIWKEILNCDDLKKMRLLLEKVINNPKVVDLFIEEFSAAADEAKEDIKKNIKIRSLLEEILKYAKDNTDKDNDL